MLSYVYMKILESRPHRYDAGIRWLSLGQAGRARQRIVDEFVRPGTRMLEIGTGTGSLAVAAARKGARVLGFDASEPMLKVAGEKVAAAGLSGRIELRAMGVGRMDELPSGAFDLVASTLVFSELSPDERAYALGHAGRVLAPGGRLVIGDESRPPGRLGRLCHSLLRMPLAALTFLLTQTTTRPVVGLDELVLAAGFRITRKERSAGGSFVLLAAEFPAAP